MRERDITAFGAVGDGVLDNTAAIRLAIKACAQAGAESCACLREPTRQARFGWRAALLYIWKPGRRSVFLPVRRLRADIYTLVRL